MILSNFNLAYQLLNGPVVASLWNQSVRPKFHSFFLWSLNIEPDQVGFHLKPVFTQFAVRQICSIPNLFHYGVLAFPIRLDYIFI